MKRYSSHYFCLFAEGKVLRNVVIEIHENREIVVFPLEGEMEATVWIPGIILLLDRSLYTSLQQKNSELFNQIETLIRELSSEKGDFLLHYTLREEMILCSFSNIGNEPLLDLLFS